VNDIGGLPSYIACVNCSGDARMKKTIAIIGAGGAMGSGLARSLTKAGYHILLAGRDAGKLQRTYAAIKAEIPDAELEVLDCLREASWEADIIIPAVPYSAQAEVAGRINDVVTGKIVVSIANPLNATFDGLAISPTTSAAEELATLLPRSKVVKSFNTVSSANLYAPVLAGSRLDCFVAGDDENAVATVSDLVRDAGFDVIHAGELSASRTLEAMMVLLIRVAMKNKYKGLAGWKVLHQAA
jgi:8-hydroxy-5-deazaflavin:NADPH oxidoreductase